MDPFDEWLSYVLDLSDKKYADYVETLTDKTFKEYLQAMPIHKRNADELFAKWSEHVEYLYTKHVKNFRPGDSITLSFAGVRRPAIILLITPFELFANGKHFLTIKFKFTDNEGGIYNIKSSEIGKPGYEFDRPGYVFGKKQKQSKQRSHSLNALKKKQASGTKKRGARSLGGSRRYR